MKIMMVTMGLGIGGAETHVVELSKELSARGNRVLVCSNGGDYVQTLEESGITHLAMPLNVRGLREMSASFLALMKALRKERPDIVHAHARIPALLASFACRLLHIPLVTSVHGKFVVTPALRLMTRWGRHALAVSEDLKRYLIESYGMPAKKITVTVNGINTRSFSPAQNTQALRKELGLPDNAKIVLSVSRLDEDSFQGPARLLALAPRLRAACGEVVFLFVGHGTRFEALQAQAEALNRAAGGAYVRMLGARTDVPRFCALCDVFVGIARSALEAMACEKPVVLAGSDGYLGLFTEKKLQDCIQTNFTCRGFAYPSDSVFEEELLSALTHPEALEKTLRAERQMVTTRYSVDRMVQDALGVYRQILTKKRWDVLLCGYYGYNNIGDEYALRAIIKNLQELRPKIRICVLTNRPEAVSRSLGVPCADRFSFPSVLEAIGQSRMMIFGGGNLLQDATSSKSLWYYLFLLCWAKHKKLPTMIYANGIGPIRKKINLFFTARVLRHIDYITLRENDSYKLVQALGITDDKVSVTADEAFTIRLDPENSDLMERYRLRQNGYLVVSIRESPNCEPNFAEKLGRALSEIAAHHGLDTVFMQMQYPYDCKISQAVAAHMTTPTKILSDLTFNDFSCLLHRARLVVGMRLHSLILGVLAGATVYGLVYDDKVESFLKNAHISLFAHCSDLHTEQLVSDMEAVLQNEAEVRKRMSLFTDSQREKAFQNAGFAVALLEKTEDGFQKYDV